MNSKNTNNHKIITQSNQKHQRKSGNILRRTSSLLNSGSLIKNQNQAQYIYQDIQGVQQFSLNNSTISRIGEGENNNHDQTGMDLLIQMCLKNGKDVRKQQTQNSIQNLKKQIRNILEGLLENIWILQSQNLQMKRTMEDQMMKFKNEVRKKQSQMKDVVFKIMKTVSLKVQEISKLSTQNAQLKRLLTASQDVIQQLHSSGVHSNSIQPSYNKSLKIFSTVQPIGKKTITQRKQLSENVNQMARSHSVHTKYSHHLHQSVKLDSSQFQSQISRKLSSHRQFHMDLTDSHEFVKTKQESVEQLSDEEDEKYIPIEKQQKVMVGNGVARRQKFKKLLNARNSKKLQIEKLEQKNGIDDNNYASHVSRSKLSRTSKGNNTQTKNTETLSSSIHPYGSSGCSMSGASIENTPECSSRKFVTNIKPRLPFARNN